MTLPLQTDAFRIGDVLVFSVGEQAATTEHVPQRAACKPDTTHITASQHGCKSPTPVPLCDEVKVVTQLPVFQIPREFSTYEATFEN